MTSDHRTAGAALAEAHAADLARAETASERRLDAFAELPHRGEWTLRSALVRFAQPRPAQAGAILELVRRTDSALRPHQRLLDSTLVVDRVAAAAPGQDPAPDIVDVVVDSRSAAIARLAGDDPDALDAVVEGYTSVTALDAAETTAAAILTAAAVLDELAVVLCRWADDRELDRPDESADELGRRTFTVLERLGVPHETRPSRRA